METESYKKFKTAEKQMKQLKGFYTHIIVFIIIVPLIFIVRFLTLPGLGIQLNDEGFENWLNWNIYLVPLLWLVVLLFQGIIVLKPNRIKQWEQRKIKELMDKEQSDANQHWN